jgi:hypothetical protein
MGQLLDSVPEAQAAWMTKPKALAVEFVEGTPTPDETQEDMKLKFLTENGTWYALTWDAKTSVGSLLRLSQTNRSGRTRHDSYTVVARPWIRIGEPARIQTSDVQPGCAAHFLVTSKVVAVDALAGVLKL